MTRRPTHQPTHRPGTTLVEVLVGLFIMSIGALGAFVLFPLSAINVSRALIDDRATTCAITADGQLREVHRRYVVEPESQGAAASESYHTRMDTGTPTDDAGPSWPVIVDPMGFAARTGASQNAIGDNGATGVPRVRLNFLGTDPTLALRFCSQLDGLTFQEDGSVAFSADMREVRYNWLWVLQRPSNRDRYTVRQQVVVFDKRAHLYAPPGSEAVVSATFAPGETVITGVPNTAEIRKGSWVMDATTGTDTGGRQLRHAEFYRVTGVTEVTNAGVTTYNLEVHKTVVRADGLVSLSNPATYSYTGSLVAMPAAVEVFERPMLTGGTGQ